MAINNDIQNSISNKDNNYHFLPSVNFISEVIFCFFLRIPHLFYSKGLTLRSSSSSSSASIVPLLSIFSENEGSRLID